jgi:hypothetical protein
VSDHLIRLRGAWESIDPDRQDQRRLRLDLPAHWDRATPRLLCLTRWFRRPLIQSSDEVLLLRFEHVPGLTRVWLNGDLIDGCTQASEPRSDGPFEIRLPNLAERNLLTLDVLLGEDDEPADQCRQAWGEIALVIRPRTASFGP